MLLTVSSSLSLWQTLLEAVKEEASSAAAASGSQQAQPSASILPCECSGTFHPLPAASLHQACCSSTAKYLGTQKGHQGALGVDMRGVGLKEVVQPGGEGAEIC